MGQTDFGWHVLFSQQTNILNDDFNSILHAWIRSHRVHPQLRNIPCPTCMFPHIDDISLKFGNLSGRIADCHLSRFAELIRVRSRIRSEVDRRICRMIHLHPDAQITILGRNVG
ncbi:hypothetical protein D3C73_971780 [compost metagenome]